MSYQILLVDADPAWRAALKSELAAEFQVRECGMAGQALQLLREGTASLLLMDSELPDMAGVALLRVLRDMESCRELPVIMTSLRKTEESVEAAFGLGVDDYVLKPAEPREVAVRVGAVLRRKYERAEHWGSALSVGGIDIDPSQRRCVVNGKRVALQPREFALLEILMRKAGRVLSRPYLLEAVWGVSREVETRAVDVMVSRLRRRLGRRAARLIETVSKMGYSLRDPELP